MEFVNGNPVGAFAAQDLDVAGEGVGSLGVEEDYVIVDLPKDVYLGGVETAVKGYVGAEPDVGVAVVTLHNNLGSGLHEAS